MSDRLINTSIKASLPEIILAQLGFTPVGSSEWVKFLSESGKQIVVKTSLTSISISPEDFWDQIDRQI